MKIWQVDSFTDKPFAGNPAGVMVLDRPLSDDLMRKIAMEMNLSETAFVLRKGDSLSIRWFTPESEVDLCGHATLAAAHTLWSEGLIKTDNLVFESKSGQLPVYRNGDIYTLDFPRQSPVEKPEYASLVKEILGVTPLYIGSNGHDCAVVLESEELVRNLSPDLEKTRLLDERGLLVSARGSHSGGYDYIYRAFFPKLGIPEDPVTGSANTLLAPYWAQALNKSTLRAYQASRRGGELYLEVESDRVLISGMAVTVLTGEFHILAA